MKKAGLAVSHPYNISLIALFENLEQIWLALGSQPTRSEMFRPLSKISVSPYDARFGGFQNAMRAFVKWKARNPARQSFVASSSPWKNQKQRNRRKTSRTVNFRLRYLVLKRDNYKCRACGRSPSNHPGLELEIDHKIPWSLGGETVEENLQTLCQKCNVGKSNLC